VLCGQASTLAQKTDLSFNSGKAIQRARVSVDNLSFMSKTTDEPFNSSTPKKNNRGQISIDRMSFLSNSSDEQAKAANLNYTFVEDREFEEAFEDIDNELDTSSSSSTEDTKEEKLKTLDTVSDRSDGAIGTFSDENSDFDSILSENINSPVSVQDICQLISLQPIDWTNSDVRQFFCLIELEELQALDVNGQKLLQLEDFTEVRHLITERNRFESFKEGLETMKKVNMRHEKSAKQNSLLKLVQRNADIMENNFRRMNELGSDEVAKRKSFSEDSFDEHFETINQSFESIYETISDIFRSNRERVNKAEKELRNTRNDLNNAQTKIGLQEKEISTLRGKLEARIDKQIKEMRLSHEQQLEVTKQRYEDDLKVIKEKAVAKKEEDSMTLLEEEIESVKAQRIKLLQEKEELLQRNEELEQEVGEKEYILIIKKKKIRKLEKEITKMKKKNDHLEETRELKSAQEDSRRFSQLLQEKESLQHENDMLSSKNKDRKKDIESMNRVMDDLQRENKVLRKRIFRTREKSLTLNSDLVVRLKIELKIKDKELRRGFKELKQTRSKIQRTRDNMYNLFLEVMQEHEHRVRNTMLRERSWHRRTEPRKEKLLRTMNRTDFENFLDSFPSNRQREKEKLLAGYSKYDDEPFGYYKGSRSRFTENFRSKLETDFEDVYRENPYDEYEIATHFRIPRTSPHQEKRNYGGYKCGYDDQSERSVRV